MNDENQENEALKGPVILTQIPKFRRLPGGRDDCWNVRHFVLVSFIPENS
jgi:hypothetical protein